MVGAGDNNVHILDLEHGVFKVGAASGSVEEGWVWLGLAGLWLSGSWVSRLRFWTAPCRRPSRATRTTCTAWR